MKLYIKVNDGLAVNHPAYEENLIQAFNLIPENWEPFVRVEKPIPGVYQILESDEPTYQKINGIWTDVWPLRDMTLEEKTAKQQLVKNNWASINQAENFSAWVFDESLCRYVPPIDPPDNTKMVFWCGAENKWKEPPLRPEGNYRFNYLTWSWIEKEVSQ